MNKNEFIYVLLMSLESFLPNIRSTLTKRFEEVYKMFLIAEWTDLGEINNKFIKCLFEKKFLNNLTFTNGLLFEL